MILEVGEPLAHLRCRVVKSARQAGGLERLGNFSHFADVTPHFGRGDGGGAQAFVFQRRLRDLPFFQQCVVHAFVGGERANGED